MNTLALLTTTDPLQAPDPELAGGFEAMSRRYISEERAPGISSSTSTDGGAMKALTETVGFRLACSSVVRWYHGGINE